jgi:hypothetical protein
MNSPHAYAQLPIKISPLLALGRAEPLVPGLKLWAEPPPLDAGSQSSDADGAKRFPATRAASHVARVSVHRCEAQLMTSDSMGGPCGSRSGRFAIRRLSTVRGPSGGTREGNGLRRAAVVRSAAHTVVISCGSAETTPWSVIGARWVALTCNGPRGIVGTPSRRGGSDGGLGPTKPATAREIATTLGYG